ncbi:thymidylate synthase [Vibrio phage VspSw_1]|uniref:thymidylate synthase n=1 Tax=Vibrio phage VspSw_1 TaxID=2484249 RepID=A0A411BKL3_9CAUD|nr:thymidylate synthase [Vibrio phage VspSw_1]QAY02109.1 thymidylate synthase [Vibrio phage VspSw_1]
MKGTQKLLELGNKILTEGEWIYNERTGKNCLTIPIHIATYDVGAGDFPIDTTRKQAYRGPIMELLGYVRGLTNAQDFADIGAPTWFSNANKTKAWLNNPHRKGENDCGQIYGAVAQADFVKVYKNLKAGIDDRGEIITFWRPETFAKACLRPCMHTHSFQLINGTLHMTSIQRSADVPMAGSWNAIQCYVLLALMAQITGHKPGKVTHIINNAHIYEDQLELFEEQMCRISMFCKPKLIINPEIKTLEDLQTWVTKEDFTLEGYASHESITYPFSE